MISSLGTLCEVVNAYLPMAVSRAVSGKLCDVRTRIVAKKKCGQKARVYVSATCVMFNNQLAFCVFDVTPSARSDRRIKSFILRASCSALLHNVDRPAPWPGSE
jgi:hypothetical protein